LPIFVAILTPLRALDDKYHFDFAASVFGPRAADARYTSQKDDDEEEEEGYAQDCNYSA
jgi:hypothetical protein